MNEVPRSGVIMEAGESNFRGCREREFDDGGGFGEFRAGVVAAWLGAVPSAVIGGLGLLIVAGRRWVGRGSAVAATTRAARPAASVSRPMRISVSPGLTA